MIVRLNESRGSFCSIGNIYFSFVDPGPRNIDLDDLDLQLLNQLLYNIRKGVLKTKDKEELTKLKRLTRQLPAASAEYSTPYEVPLKNDEVPDIPVDKIFEKMEREEKILKDILKENVDTVKSKSVELPASQVRKLLDLELQLKKRASVIRHCEQLIVLHRQNVQRQVGTTDLEAAQNQADLTRGLKKVNLDNVGDVVESDLQQIVLNPMQKEE